MLSLPLVPWGWVAAGVQRPLETGVLVKAMAAAVTTHSRSAGLAQEEVVLTDTPGCLHTG